MLCACLPVCDAHMWTCVCVCVCVIYSWGCPRHSILKGIQSQSQSSLLLTSLGLFLLHIIFVALLSVVLSLLFSASKTIRNSVVFLRMSGVAVRKCLGDFLGFYSQFIFQLFLSFGGKGSMSTSRGWLVGFLFTPSLPSGIFSASLLLTCVSYSRNSWNFHWVHVKD